MWKSLDSIPAMKGGGGNHLQVCRGLGHGTLLLLKVVSRKLGTLIFTHCLFPRKHGLQLSNLLSL